MVRFAPFLALAAALAAPPVPSPTFRFSEECGRVTSCATDTDCDRECGHLPSVRELMAWEAAERAQAEAMVCRVGDTVECSAARRNREASARLNKAVLAAMEAK